MNHSLVHGIFVEEIKNRFLCIVSIEGVDTLCYIPSSCRLGNFLSMEGRTVLLNTTSAPNAKTSYSIFAIKVGRKYIPVNLSGINTVVEKQLSRRLFSFLGKRTIILREKTVQGYKCDLFLPETNTVIEVKTVLSFDAQALFPSVNSERAIRQLTNIYDLLDKGYKVCYMFISLNPQVESIMPNPEMKQYVDMFKKCTSKGMVVCGYKAWLQGTEIKLGNKLTVVG